MRLLPLYWFVLLLAACGGTTLSPAVAKENAMQAADCEEALHLLQFDAGAAQAATMAQARADMRVCVCGARFTLAQAGQPLPDAGREGCPQ